MNKEQIIFAWARGWYSLGWRGWLALKILGPVLEEKVVDESV